MKKRLISFFKFFIFLALGGVLLWYTFRGQDFNQIRAAIKDADLWWIGLTLLIGLASHISRAIRWRMLIVPLGYRPKLINTFMAVMVGYFANLAFPRLGEVTKCGILKQYEGIPINRLLGTMIVERAVDLVCLLLCLALVILLEFKLLSDFFLEWIFNPLAGKVLDSQMGLAIAGAAFAGLVILFVILRPRIRHSGFYIKLRELAYGVLEGVRTIGRMKNKGAFIFHSMLIWGLYFLMSYVALFAFTGTESLGATAALAVFVFGSFGMVAPVQGGIGAYHLMASKTLELYNVTQIDALAYAFVMHGGQTFLLIVFGFLSLIMLPVLNKAAAKPGPGTAPESL